MQDDFIRRLVAMGIPQQEIRDFIEDKGAYTLDAELMAHCLKMGFHYDRPLGMTSDPMNLQSALNGEGDEQSPQKEQFNDWGDILRKSTHFNIARVSTPK